MMNEVVPNRRRRPSPESGAGEDDALATGLPKREEDQFENFSEILDKTHAEFMRAAPMVQEKGGHEYLRQEANFRHLLQQIVSQNPEWKVAPGNIPLLEGLLRKHMFGYGVLEDYLAIDDLEEIIFNRFDRGWFIVRGEKRPLPPGIFPSEKALRDFCVRVVAGQNQHLNYSTPMVDSMLADGSRISVSIPPVALYGTELVIRKHLRRDVSLEEYVASDAITLEAAKDINRFVKGRLNILISGGTASGKTTLLRAIVNACVPKNNRLLILEEVHEIEVNLPDVTVLLTKDSGGSAVEENKINIWDLVARSLRKRPDRIIVGEVRSKEAYAMLRAWNTGHPGSIATMHADRALSALNTLRQLARSAGELDDDGCKDLIASTVNIVVQLNHDKRLNKRLVREIVQVIEPLQLDRDAETKVAELEKEGHLRRLWDNCLVLTLYHRRGGELVKVADPLPIDGIDI